MYDRSTSLQSEMQLVTEYNVQYMWLLIPKEISTLTKKEISDGKSIYFTQ